MIRVSWDTDDLDRARVCAWLLESYWAKGRCQETFDKSFDNSICFSAFREGEQVGFARVVTDRATFGWLCDVIVDEECRGQGVGHALMEAVISHPDLREIKRLFLATRDADWLYRQFEFVDLPNATNWMVRLKSVGEVECIQ